MTQEEEDEILEKVRHPQGPEGYGEMGLDVYWKILETILPPGNSLWGGWAVDAEAVIKELGARDGIEKLMLDQILWLHGRLARLTLLSCRRKKLEEAEGYHAAADRLTDTLRRHMAAFASYRYPERKRFVAVNRANIAEQQIVIDGRNKRGRPRLGTRNLKLETRGGMELPVRQAQGGPVRQGQGGPSAGCPLPVGASRNSEDLKLEAGLDTRGLKLEARRGEELPLRRCSEQAPSTGSGRGASGRRRLEVGS